LGLLVAPAAHQCGRPFRPSSGHQCGSARRTWLSKGRVIQMLRGIAAAGGLSEFWVMAAWLPTAHASIAAVAEGQGSQSLVLPVQLPVSQPSADLVPHPLHCYGLSLLNGLLTE
jgi:hypothetical protein